MNFGDELSGWSGRAHVAIENLLKRNVATVEVFCGFVVLLDLGSIDVDTGEESLRARIGQNLRIEFPVCVCGCSTPDRTGCGTGVDTNFELAL